MARSPLLLLRRRRTLFKRRRQHEGGTPLGRALACIEPLFGRPKGALRGDVKSVQQLVQQFVRVVLLAVC